MSDYYGYDEFDAIDDEEAYGFDDLEDEDMLGADADLWDLDAEDEADQLLGSSAVLAGLGSAGTGYLTGKLYDKWLAGLERKARTEQNRRLRLYGPKTHPTPAELRYKKWKGHPDLRGTLVRGTGAAGGLLGAALGALNPLFEDGDSFEPEYSSEDIEHMEALAEEALEAEGEDAVLAADEMVSRSFGLMRAAARMRPVIAAIRQRVRRMIVLAKRDPRYRALARIAPLALRRTAVILLRMMASGKRVDAKIAMRVFAGVLQGLMRSSRTRDVAVRQAQIRARRYRARRGQPAPVRVRRPVYTNAARRMSGAAAAHQ
jgi:hypothetical protein